MEVVDLNVGRVVRRIDGLREPQGVLVLESHALLVVSEGGRGTLDFFDSRDYRLIERVPRHSCHSSDRPVRRASARAASLAGSRRISAPKS